MLKRTSGSKEEKNKFVCGHIHGDDCDYLDNGEKGYQAKNNFDICIRIKTKVYSVERPTRIAPANDCIPHSTFHFGFQRNGLKVR